MNTGWHSRVSILDSRKSFASCSYRQSRVCLEVGIFFKVKVCLFFALGNPCFWVDFLMNSMWLGWVPLLITFCAFSKSLVSFFLDYLLPACWSGWHVLGCGLMCLCPDLWSGSWTLFSSLSSDSGWLSFAFISLQWFLSLCAPKIGFLAFLFGCLLFLSACWLQFVAFRQFIWFKFAQVHYLVGEWLLGS